MSTPQVRIALLGQPFVMVGEQRIDSLLAEKTIVMLAYLATEGSNHTRQALAGLLWGGMPEARAQANLRMAIYTLQKHAPGLLQVDRRSLAIAPDLDCWLDVADFETLADVRFSAEDPSRLEVALTLYRGEFLSGVAVNDAFEIEPWLQRQRERLRCLAVTVTERLVHFAGQRSDNEASIALLRQLLTLEPWREQAHVSLMRLLARSGMYSAALAQYERCQRVLAHDLGIEPMPTTKALAARIKAARLRVPTVLPAQPLPLFGRAFELQQIEHLLDDPQQRLITLVGLGGIGKTHLAIEAAHRQSYHFLDGVVLVSLANATGRDQLVAALTAALNPALNIPIHAEAQLLSALADRECLLIFDAFEHVLAEGAAFVAMLLSQTSALKVLATSRERLNLRWESVLSLDGLTCPAESAEPAAIAQSEAVQLFVHTARRVQSAFDLLPHAQTVAQICRYVEGIPLGVELAAAKLSQMSCSQIAEQLRQSLDALSTDMHDVPLRQRSLRMIVQQALNQLSPPDRRLFTGLAVFQSSFSLAAACAVTEAQARQVSELANKSLVRLIGGDRYEIHEVLRRYVLEDPELADAIAIAQRRHSAYFLEMVQEHGASRSGVETPSKLSDLQADIDNVRQAWQWSVTHDDIATFGPYLGAISAFYTYLSLFHEGEQSFRNAVVRVRALLRDVPDLSITMIAALGKLLAEWALLTNIMGMHSQAIEAASAAVELAERIGNSELLAQSYTFWGWACFSRGEYAEALRCLDAGLGQARASTIAQTEAHCLRFIGSVHLEQGRYSLAEAYFADSVALCRQIDEQQGIAWALHDSGLLFYQFGDYDTAREALAEALLIWQTSGPRNGEGFVLADLALITCRQNDRVIAASYARQALQLAEELRASHLRARALVSQGYILTEQGALAQACAAFQEATQIRRSLEQPQMTLDALAGLAQVTLEQANLEGARLISRDILALLAERGLDGALDPPMVMRACDMLHQALADEQAAAVAARARALINARASHITGPARRAQFLERAMVNPLAHDGL